MLSGCGSLLQNRAIPFRIEQRLDLAQVAHGPLEMAAKRRRGLIVPLARDEIENLQMLAAMLRIARPVEHGPVGQQAPNAVDALNGRQEERVPGGADERLVEAHAALMQRIRAVRLDGTGEKPLLGARSRSAVSASSR